jgi:hypothetical protein
MKDLTKRDSWEGPRDKEDRAFYKIAQRTLWLGPQADLLVTKTLFLERDADTKIQTIESNSKNSPIPVAPPPKGVHQVYRLLLSGRLLREKACIKSFNSTCRFISFPHTPAKRSGE